MISRERFIPHAIRCATVGLAIAAMLLPGCATERPGRTSLSVRDGVEVSGCGWPNVVVLEHAGGRCSGTLVHPRVVLYAAHCGTAVSRIGFGPRGSDVSARPMRCALSPDFEEPFPGVTRNDVAVCVLPDPIDTVPIIPLATACEAAIVTDGAPAHVVGFGDSAPGAGAGVKRAGTVLLGGAGAAPWPAFSILPDPASTCPADSGSPVFYEMPGGGFLQLAVNTQGDTACAGGAGRAHAVHPHLAWMEAETGLDLTPCRDAATGVRDASGGCATRPTEPAIGAGAWPACSAGPTVPDSPMCVGGADASVPESDAGSLDAGALDAGGGDAGAEEPLDAAASRDAGRVVLDGGGPSDTGVPNDAGEVGADRGPSEGAPGCSCRAVSGSAGAGRLAWLSLAMALATRARRRRASAHRSSASAERARRRARER